MLNKVEAERYLNGIFFEDYVAILLGYSQGADSFDMARQLDVSGAELVSLEQDIKARLQAKTKLHMIARAYELGIIKL